MMAKTFLGRQDVSAFISNSFSYMKAHFIGSQSTGVVEECCSPFNMVSFVCVCFLLSHVFSPLTMDLITLSGQKPEIRA